jgi:colicin import membrane protein
MNIVALEQLWAKKDAETVAEQARLTGLANPQDLLKLRKKWARGQAIRQAYREKKRALAGQPKPEKPKKPIVYEPWIIAAVRKVEEDRTKASHAKQDAKLAAKREAEDAKRAAKLQAKRASEDAKVAAKRAAEDAKLEAKRAAKLAVEDAKLEAKRAAEDKRRAQSRAVQAAERDECRKAADAKTQTQAPAQAEPPAQPPAQKARVQKGRVQFEETEASV